MPDDTSSARSPIGYQILLALAARDRHGYLIRKAVEMERRAVAIDRRPVGKRAQQSHRPHVVGTGEMVVARPRHAR